MLVSFTLKRLTTITLLSVVLLFMSGATAGEESEVLYPVRTSFKMKHGLKWKFGFMNRAGKTVIEAQFSKVNYFKEGAARVAIAGDWGYIDKNGEYIVEPSYGWAQDFSDGLAQVMIRSENNGETVLKTGFIDQTGKLAIKASFDFNSRKSAYFKDGLAPVARDGQWGFINKKGVFVIEPTFEEAHNFAEGFAAVEQNGRWGYVDQEGKTVIPFTFEQASHFAEGLAAVMVDGKWGFIDTNGKTIIEPAFGYRYYGTPAFKQGLANMMQGEQWGFIDTEGRFKIEPQFELAAAFHDGRAKIVQNGKTGFIDSKGNVVIDPQYVMAEDFYHGLAFVMTQQNPDQYAYIDTSGKIVWQSGQ